MRRGFWLIAVMAATCASAQVAPPDDAMQTPAATRRAMAEATTQAAAARSRAERLEAEAASASASADRTAHEAAAIAARIQQTQAEIAAGEARIHLIAQQRDAVRARLAERQRPLVRLTAALQRLSRRPVIVSLLRPGSVLDAVHQRALLATMLPEVRRRTADLRVDLARMRALEAQARAAEQGQIAQKRQLSDRRQAMAVLESQQRLNARAVSGSADREAERALALAEQARDLGGLIDGLEQAASLRERLAGLPGPVIRPSHPEQLEEALATESGSANAAGPVLLGGYALPVDGRLVTGFGGGGGASRGIALAVRGGAQVVAPAAGRVVFADAYPGYGQIAIVDHPGGWTSVITGLARLDVRVGDELVAGSPLGVAPQRGVGVTAPVVNLELRRDGQPVNPLDQLRGP